MGGAQEGTMQLAELLADFQSLPLLPKSKLGPSGADSQVGGLCMFWNPGLRSLYHSPVVPFGLSAHKCETTLPASLLSAPAAALCPYYLSG